MSWNFDDLSPGETVKYDNEYKLFTKTEFNHKYFLLYMYIYILLYKYLINCSFGLPQK